MKPGLGSVIVVGLAAGIACSAGYAYDPAQQVTLVVTLVCGMGAVFYQLSVRDLQSRIQAQIDRAAEKTFEDGGRLLTETRATRDRVAALARTQMIVAALAPSLAAARSIYPLPILSGLAFGSAAAAVVLAVMFEGANREYARLVEDERAQRGERENLTALAKERKAVPDVDAIAAADPGLGGYTSPSVEAKLKH